MRVVVIGSGLIGLATTVSLCSKGHAVTVIDQEDGPGQQTSFANGSLLTPSMSDPWNAPGSWRVLLSSLINPNSPLKLRLGQIPRLSGWGLQFLSNSRSDRFSVNTLKNLKLSLHSLCVLEELRKNYNISYDANFNGTMKVFRSSVALENSASIAAQLRNAGLNYLLLNTEESIAAEPALYVARDQIVGAIRYPSDESGDAYKFCLAMKEVAIRMGAEFIFSTKISGFEQRGDRLVAAVSNGKRYSGDAFVIAAGSYSVSLLQSLRMSIPIAPAKGYSITYRNPPPGFSLRTPIIDDDLHAVVVPVGSAIRVAGTAEFAGFDLSLNRARVRNLQHLISSIFPEAGFGSADGIPWCGLRPMSVDGVPLIGRTAIENLYLNCGHGHLGWTMAAGSGDLLADVISGKNTLLDSQDYSLARFSH